MTVISGQKCAELYANFSQLGCLVRMCLESSIWHSTRCLLTWKTSATPHRRLLFQLAVSMPRTDETGSQFWPTPKTTAVLGGCSGAMKTLRKMAEKHLITEEERKSLAAGNGGKTNPQLLEWLMGYEQKFTDLIPTPRTSDYNGAAVNRAYSQTVQVERERERAGYRGQLCELVEVTPLGKIGLMNPEWTEWLMGYPIGWTDLNV